MAVVSARLLDRAGGECDNIRMSEERERGFGPVDLAVAFLSLGLLALLMAASYCGLLT
jgi:hypothetical protein